MEEKGRKYRIEKPEWMNVKINNIDRNKDRKLKEREDTGKERRQETEDRENTN